jgi:hypothetical protein
MFSIQSLLVGIYAVSGDASKVQLSNFSVTTTSGTILVDWGDGLSETLSSAVPIDHSFSCPGDPAAPGFWNNIQPCI